MEGLEFRHFSAETELTAQRALFRDCFPENEGLPPESERWYRWKFHGMPCEPQSYEYGGYVEGQMIGYYAALPFRYVLEGSERRAGMVCDVMTHSAMRGKGIFTKIGRYSLAELGASGVEFLLGYPIRDAVIPGHLKVGWQIAFELPLYLKFLRLDTILAERGLGFLAPAGRLGCALYHTALAPSKAAAFQCEVLDADAFFARFDYAAFFAAWAATQKYYLIKDEAFLRWRLGAPGNTYRFICISKGGALQAVAISSATVLKGVPSLAILDLMHLPGAEAALGPLHAAMLDEARATGREAIATMMSRTWAAKYRLLRHGFVRSPFIFKLILKDLTSGTLPANFLAEQNWHLMWADSDDV